MLEAARAGVPAIVVHPSRIIGPYDERRNHLVQVVKDLMEGHLPACVKGGYDMVDVRDVAKGCIQAVELGRSGKCCILSGSYSAVTTVSYQSAKLAGEGLDYVTSLDTKHVSVGQAAIVVAGFTKAGG